MDTSFFSQQKPYCLATLLVYMALAKLIYAQWNVKGLMTTLYNYFSARNWAKLAGWWGKLT